MLLPALYNEYESRSVYYDQWLKEILGDNGVSEAPKLRHEMLLKKRSQAYEQLCDAVYEEKGFSPEGVPLYASVEKFGLMDEQAKRLLAAIGMTRSE